MSSPPRFSIVIPTHNRADLVVQAVRSVLDQTVTDFELIVVDDGSTDDTSRSLEPYRERLILVRQAQSGPAAARNTGVRQAQGQVVGFLDSDDLWEPETLAEVAAELERRPEAGLVAIQAREIDAGGNKTGRILGKATPGDDYSTRSILWGDAGRCSWFFVYRSLLNEIGGFDETLRSAEECDLCLRLSRRTLLVALRRSLVLRRTHGDNLSYDMALNARCWIQSLEKLADQHPDFLEQHPWAYRRALGKERLRLGRELLAQANDIPEQRHEARRQLRASIGTFPFSRRAVTYLAWSWIAPRRYAGFRQREMQRRARRTPTTSG
jgi:glycosyltransferase involved in cell wall biosynthesis